MQAKSYQFIVMVFSISPLVLYGCEENHDDKTQFVYNAATGYCENHLGEIGYNNFDIIKIRQSRNAECLDLSGKELVYLLDTAKIEDFNRSGYNTLEDYNFRGSSFNGSEIFFNNIDHSDFSGADLSNLEYGYAVISGKIDAFTILPSSGCSTANDSLTCRL